MKQSDITYQDKLNELRLDLSHPNSRGINFVLVEGQSDIRLFRKFFNLDSCKVERIPGGNKKLEECVDTIINIYPFVIGIRDSDFLRLENQSYNNKNIFLTDYHDIEMTVLNQEPILNSLIFEFSELDRSEHLVLRDKILESISSLGYLKWLNFRENLELEFTCGFHDLIDFINLKIDIDQYINRVISKSINAKVKSKEIILIKLELLKKENPDLLQLTNGHDLLNTFAKYFREEMQIKGLSGENLESSIRMLFNDNFFTSTELYRNLVNWEVENETKLFVK